MIFAQFAVLAATAALVPPPPSFAICSACHATRAGAPAGIGPSLLGVIGRKAGSAPGYAYSTAMAKSGIIWTQEQLGAFIESPQKTTPGTKMPFGGEKDAARRAAIVQFLGKLK